MPFYEYECDACAHRFELFHGMNENPAVTCDRCRGAVRRILFAPSVIFKGGGFYATEYGKSTHNNPKKSATSGDGGSALASTASSSEKAEAKTDSKSDSKSEAKSETKPETKPETKGEKPAASCAPDSLKKAA